MTCKNFLPFASPKNSHKYKKGEFLSREFLGQRERKRDGRMGPDLWATQTDYLLPLEEFNYVETDLEWVIDPAVSVRSQNNLFLTLLLEIEDENFLKAPNKIVWRWGSARVLKLPSGSSYRIYCVFASGLIGSLLSCSEQPTPKNTVTSQDKKKKIEPVLALNNIFRYNMMHFLSVK